MFTLRCCKNYISFHAQFTRALRTPSRNNPKTIEGKVKTLTQYDELANINSYEDLVKDAKQLSLGDELDIEKTFAEGGKFGNAIEECERYYAQYLSEEKEFKSRIKKQLIGRKYFKLDKETNLLTYAAKEQIRYLHKSNPAEWNPKTISECFPITESGVKKLLKCNFKLTSIDKIQEHDEKVAQRWKILKSGIHSPEISDQTWKFYKEGKLVDDYFGGNPNLPTVPAQKTELHISKRKKIGEFSSIVQTYVEYQNQKLLMDSGHNKEENQLQLAMGKGPTLSKMKLLKESKYAAEEFDNETVDLLKTQRKTVDSKIGDIPLSQFKEILKSESMLTAESENEHEYSTNKTLETKSAISTSLDSHDSFIEISKYDRNSQSNIYTSKGKYYQKYQKLKKLNLPINLSKSKKVFKRGKCIYDSDGEFMYKLPS